MMRLKKQTIKALLLFVLLMGVSFSGNNLVLASSSEIQDSQVQGTTDYQKLKDSKVFDEIANENLNFAHVLESSTIYFFDSFNTNYIYVDLLKVFEKSNIDNSKIMMFKNLKQKEQDMLTDKLKKNIENFFLTDTSLDVKELKKSDGKPYKIIFKESQAKLKKIKDCVKVKAKQALLIGVQKLCPSFEPFVKECVE